MQEAIVNTKMKQYPTNSLDADHQMVQVPGSRPRQPQVTMYAVAGIGLQLWNFACVHASLQGLQPDVHMQSTILLEKDWQQRITCWEYTSPFEVAPQSMWHKQHSELAGKAH